MLQGLLVLALDSGLVIYQQVFNGPCFFVSTPADAGKHDADLQFYLLLYATYTASRGIAVNGSMDAARGIRYVKHEGVVLYLYPNEELNTLLVVSVRTIHFDYKHEDFASFAAAVTALLHEGGCSNGYSNKASLKSIKKEMNDLIVAQFQFHYGPNASVVAMYKRETDASVAHKVNVREATQSYESGNKINSNDNKYNCLYRLCEGLHWAGSRSSRARRCSGPARGGVTVAVPSFSNLKDEEVRNIVHTEHSSDYHKHNLGDYVYVISEESVRRGGSLVSITESGMLLLWLQLICILEIGSDNIVKVLKV